MADAKSDYPIRRSFGFSNEQWKLLQKASDVTGNTKAYLVRRWIENGAKREITEARRNKEN